MAETMKAFGLADEDSPAGFLAIPAPNARPGEVRIRVRGSSVNGYDRFVAAGMARGSMEHRYPVLVGKDYAGVIDAVGDGVDRFAVGDEVTGIVPPAPHVASAAYAEYLAIPAAAFVEPKPDRDRNSAARRRDVAARARRRRDRGLLG
jgi:NADPH:quinone reductase-like Zn-dependent oxidoreductase